MKSAGVEFVKLDVDQHPEIAGANGVMGVPTVVMLKGWGSQRTLSLVCSQKKS
jgi:hypothetical protein